MAHVEDDHFLDFHFAMHALEQAAEIVHSPDLLYREWFDLSVALLMHGRLEHYTMMEIVALAARSVVRDVHKYF